MQWLPDNFARPIPGLGTPFARNVLKLFTGSSLKNLIVFLALPVLTRLYAVSDFGLFQLMLSVAMTFSILSTLKYELAIVLPRFKREADHLVVLTLLALVGTTVLFALLFAFAGDALLGLLKAQGLAPYKPLVVAAIFATGLVLGVRYILVRERAFGRLAANNVVQAAVTQAGSIGLGLAQASFLGLFVSYTVGCLVAAGMILAQARIPLRRIRRRLLCLFARKHRKFPLINTVSMFINQLSLELPVFLFARFYGAEIVGFYTLAHRLVTTPLNLVQTSVGQVYYQEASAAYNESPARLMQVYLNTVRKLALIGLVPLALALLVAPTLVKVYAGPEWATSGAYIRIIIFGLYFGFINAPIGTTYSIIGRQEIILGLRVVSIIVRFGAMVLLRSDPILMLWALSGSMSLYYIVSNALVYVNVRRLTARAA